jgi:hypothetical protein
MKIQVRIVGIYFRKEVEVAENATVWEVTKAAEAASGGSLRITGETSIERVEYDTNPTRDESPTNTDRRAGTYVLSEDETVRSRSLVWQYYIHRPTRKIDVGEKKVQLYETVSADGTAKFAVVTRGLKDGDQIMWRLLAIGLDPAGPVSPPPPAQLS